MKKRTKLLVMMLLGVLLSINQVWAADVSFTYVDFDGQGTSGQGSAISATKDGITLSSDLEYGNTTNTRVHVYSGATLTISSASGITITGIAITSTATQYNGGLNAEYTPLSTTLWSQELTKQLRFTNIVVSYSGSAGGSPTYTDYLTECAPEDKTFYLNTGGTGLWNANGSGQPKFAIYWWNSTTSGWSEFMTPTTCNADIYEGTIPANADNMIFVRLKNTCMTPAWGTDNANVWNKSGDLAVPTNSDDQYTINGWGSDGVSTGSWGVYAPSTFTISFNDNGADAGAAMTEISGLACGSDRALPAMTRTKVGHDFAGWKADKDVTVGGSPVAAGTLIAAGATLQNISANIQLIAQWNVKSYTLTWDFAGGTTTSGDGEYTHGSVEFGAPITAPADPEKEGNDFLGWGVAETATTMPAENLTYTAQWQPKVYAVKWYVNGTELTIGSQSTSASHGDAMSTLTLPTPPNDDALACANKFMGWSETDLGKDEGQDAPGDLFTSLTSNATQITGEKNFYAVFASGEGGAGFKLVTTPTAGKNYVFASVNAAGNGYAIPCGTTDATMEKGTAVTVTTVGDDKVIATTDANLIWAVASGNDYTAYNAANSLYIKINGSAISTSEASCRLFWSTSNGLYGKSNNGDGSTSYYAQCVTSGSTKGNISKGTTIATGNSRFYAYEEFDNAVYSNYVTRCCTPLAAPTNLSAVGTTHGITFNWTKAANATGYRVTYTDGENPVDLEVGDVNAVSTTVELECGGGTDYTWSIVSLYSGAGEYCAESEPANAAEAVRTAYCACENYSFHYGTKNQGDWNDDNPVCFTETEIADGFGGHLYFSRNFTMPNKPDFNVAWAGTPQGYTETVALSGMSFYLANTKTLGTISDGNNVGAIGTLVVHGNYNSQNKLCRFVPGGYVLKIGEHYDSYAFNPADADNVLETVWTTDLMTLDENMLTHKIQVLLKTASGSVWSPNMSSDADVNGHVGQKSGAETWGTNLSAADAGKKGKFRIWADNAGANWSVHFVPYISLKYDANGGSGSMTATSPISCEESEANRTVDVAACTFTAPANKHFLKWNTAADGSGDDVNIGTGAYTLAGADDVTLYAIWEDDERFTITFYNEGNSYDTHDLFEGQAVTKPSDPSASCAGYTFLGWTSNPDADAANAVEAVVTTMPNEAKNYYALYRHAEGATEGLLYSYNGTTNGTNMGTQATTNGTDTYKEANAPYLIKFDGTSDYVIIDCGGIPTSIYLKGKMFSNDISNATTFSIQESSDGTSGWTTVDTWTLGTATGEYEYTSTETYSQQYIKLQYNIAKNTGLGIVTINGIVADYSYTTRPECVDWVLDNLTITTPPTKTIYTECETFDNTGLVVKANFYEEGNTSNTKSVSLISSEYTCEPAMGAGLSTSDAYVRISYTFNEVTKYVDQPITVNEATKYSVVFYDGSHAVPASSMMQTCPNAEVDFSTKQGEHACGDYTFVGWTTTSTVYNDEPASLEFITSATPTTADINVYAVYSQNAASSDFTANCAGGNYTIKANDGAVTAADEINGGGRLYTYEYYHDQQGNDCGKVFAITKVGENTYTIKNSDGDYLSYSSSLSWTPTLDNKAKWTVTADATYGDWNFANVNSNTYSLMYYSNYFQVLATSSLSSTGHYNLELTPAAATTYQSNPNCEPFQIIFVTNGGVIATEPTGLTLNLNGNQYESQQISVGETADFQLPTATYDDWTFEGWKEGNAQEETIERPGLLIEAGTQQIVSNNKTYYAVYSKLDEDKEWDPVVGGTYHLYAIKSDGTTKKFMQYATLSKTEATITGVNDCASCTDITIVPGAGIHAGQYQLIMGTQVMGGESAKPGFIKDDNAWWTITESGHGKGTYRIAEVGIDNRAMCLMNNSFGNYAITELNNGAQTTYRDMEIGICQLTHYTSLPQPKKTIELVGTNLNITSTQGVSMECAATATVAAANFEVGSQTKLYITFDDAALSVKGTNVTKDGGNYYVQTTTAGTLAAETMTITYAPTTAGDGSVQTVHMYVADNEDRLAAETVKYLTLKVRNLPARFVIAQEIGGEWYALPNEMSNNYSSSTAALKMKYNSTEDRYEIPALTDGQYAYSLLAGKKTKSSLVFSSPMKTGNIIKVHGTKGNGAIGLYASSGLTPSAGDNYEFAPNSTNLIDYKLHNPFQEAYLGISDGNWGVGAETNVRFLPYYRVEPMTEITAHANGGVFDEDATYCITNMNYGSSDPCCGFPTRNGYNFVGYSITQNGNDKVFEANGSMVDNCVGYVTDGKWSFVGTELNIYAMWEPIALTISGDIKVTSTKDKTVRALMTATATGDFTSGTLTIADATGSEGGSFSAVITNATATGEGLNATIAINYTPTQYDVTETATMHAVIYDQDVEFTVIGRSLPEKFVIATKVDGAWYALTNLNPSNTYTTRALIPIKVDNATSPTAATVYSSTENAMAWTLDHIMVSKRADYGTGAHFTRAIDTKALAGNASGLEFGAAVPAGTADDYLNHIWVANSTDLANYTMDNVGAAGYSISASAAGFGMSNESAATLRFLAYTKEAPKTVTWYNAMLGSEFAHNAAENGMITIPAGTPAACDAAAGAGYTFYGWRAGEIATYETKAQTLIVDGQTALSDVTYYAVFKSADATPKYRTACPSVNSITFKANGGTGADYKVYTELTTYVAPYYDTEAGFTAPANHVFVGWLADGDPDYSHIIKPNGTNKITGLSGDVVYNAIWVGELNVTANVNLTTGNGIAVYTTPESGNLITLSSADFAAVTSIKITYKDKSGTVVTPANSLFRICYAPEYVAAGKNVYEVADASNLPVSTSGAYEYKYAISYTPKAANQMDEGTILLEAYRNTTNLSSTEFKVYGRSLPERFVIAMKNPNNGYWYALKNELGSTAAGATPAPEMITVDNNTNPTKATLAPASTFYKTAARFEPMSHRGAVRFQQYAGSKYLTATKTDNTSFYMPAGNDDDQQFYLNSTDLSKYKVTLDPATGSTRYISMNGGTIGWFATEAKDVYFLPIETVQTPVEFQVVEWKTSSVVVMYTGSAATATTQVGSNAASSAQTLSTAKKDHCVYELSTVDLTSEYGKVLTVQFADGSSKMICVPLIVSGETTASVGTAGNDVVVLKNGTFKAENTERRYPNITVYGGGKLVIGNGMKLAFSNLYLRCGGVVDGNYDYVYPQVVLNGQLNSSLNSQLYIDYVTTTDQYYTFVAPFAISQANIQYPQDIYGSNVTATNTGSFEFEYYDGAARAAGGSGWTTLPDAQDIVPGQGYTFLGMPKKINGTRQTFGLHRMHMPVVTAAALTHETSDQSIAVAPYPSEKDNNAGWNRIGNPYMATVTGLDNNSIQVGELVHTEVDGKWTGGWEWSNSQRFLVMPSDDGQSYTSVQASTAELPAFKSFFVQIAEGSSLVIPVAHRATSVAARAMTEEEQEIEIPMYMQTGDFKDALTYLIKSDYTNAFDKNADYYKMLNNKDTRVNFYGLMGEMEMSFVAVNEQIIGASVPVGYSVPAAGTYTIGVEDDVLDTKVQNLLLTDHETEITTDLMAAATYEFNVGQKETNNTRFTLRVVMKANAPTDMEGVDAADGIKPRKIIYDDKLFILVGGKVYDGTGKLMNK